MFILLIWKHLHCALCQGLSLLTLGALSEPELLALTAGQGLQ